MSHRYVKFCQPDKEAYLGAILSEPFETSQTYALYPFNGLARQLAPDLTPYSVAKPSSMEEIKALQAEHPHLQLVLCETDPVALSKILLDLLDYPSIRVLAPVTPHHFSKRPLFLISIPKAGTHLLFELARAMGYTDGISFNERLNGGSWYCLEYTNAHTRAKDFFIDTVRRAPFGNRHHPFPHTPALFNYRHPLDILVSEANYYHREGKTAFSGYLRARTLDERIKLLIQDPWLLDTLRERVGGFIPWLSFENVIPVSFEEMVGASGGSSEKFQEDLIWSLQLKLHVPGNPREFARKVFNIGSDTFREGQIGGYRKVLTDEHWKMIESLGVDFMSEFGYAADTIVSKRIDEFRKRPLVLEAVNFEQTPIGAEFDYLGHNIVRYQGWYYGIPFGMPFDFNSPDPAHMVAVSRAQTIQEVKAHIAAKVTAAPKARGIARWFSGPNP